MSRVELFERIRRDHRLEELSIRELSRRHRVHRRTVRQALVSAVPLERKATERDAPVLGPWKSIIDGWLREDVTAPRKQRHTARRVWERLVEEQGADVAESTVRAYVLEARRRIRDTLADVAVPQQHGPGEEAEVDFGQFDFWLAGVLTRAWLFCMRLSHSGRSFHRAYLNEAQESFFDGHVRAFAHFGGVPTVQIRYDNLKPAVVRVLLGRNRLENDRFVSLRSHYGFDAFFCLPGERGAHEKGGVEGEVGRFRRRHLVPVPKVASMHELNELIAAGDAKDELRRINGRRLTVGEHFALERFTLAPMAGEPFDAATLLRCRVDAKARICVRQAHYSVPARLAGRMVAVRLHAAMVEVVEGGAVVARHDRAHHKKVETLVLDHYLEVLQRKPGALPGATALAQARASGAFTEAHDAFWAAARRRRGDRRGTRELVEILLAHRTLPAAALVRAMTEATAAGITDAQIVIVTARRLAETAGQGAKVIPIGNLTRYDRPAPELAGYDQLLDEVVR